MKYLKTFLLMFGIGISLIILLIFAIIFAIKKPCTTAKEIKKEFIDNYSNIKQISEFLSESEYSNISIHNTDYIYEDGLYGYWYADGQKIPIENKEIVSILDFLFKKRKYDNIGKSEDTIRFQLWSNLDSSRGLAYSVSGKEPELQLLTYSEKLDIGNWYYYETDLNEWKRRNK